MHFAQTDPVLSILSSAGLPLLGVISIFAVGVFLVTGYSMKFSLAVAGVGHFGFWKSTGISFATTTAVFFVSCLMAVAMFLLKGESVVVGLISAFLSVTAFALVIAVMGKCGIVRGYVTYFLNGFFVVAGFVLLAIVMVPVMMVAAPMMKIDPDDLASLRQAFPQDGLSSIRSPGDGSSLGLDSLRNVSLNPDDRHDSDSALESLPQNWLPVRSSDASIQDAFYQRSQTPASSGEESPSVPVTRGVQANPFVQ
ncbi:hypothetical protein [Neorhodopirellula pilleata]|uniref:Yip1 domain-containing protein n=1 Tax=Neorhodopirellula pilleata TaxID=2714738 RepID=A0A5C6ADP3_9BACT|nr:hypothetical protein [Neorhodopirellula pilleata]TWT97527.1 hypothetical protein Pla100_26810 [Neorhodopirellula pilleata]